MTTARRLLIDRTRPTWVHCTSRCVRRALTSGLGSMITWPIA